MKYNEKKAGEILKYYQIKDYADSHVWQNSNGA
jgi:hypothetical protein